MQRAVLRAGIAWVLAWIRVLVLCSYPILGAAIAFYFSAFSDQGVDLLLDSLPQPGSTLTTLMAEHPAGVVAHLLLSAAAVIIAALSIWWPARLLVRREFPFFPIPQGPTATLRKWLPRVLGTIVVLGVAVGYGRMALRFRNVDAGLAAGGWALAAVFLCVVLSNRRNWYSSVARKAPGIWPTYHGDNNGQHHSKLTQITAGNVGKLSLSWVYKAQVPGSGIGLKPALKATPIEVDGVLYFSMPNQVWAIDARTGREIWTYTTKSGNAIGNRGVAVHNGTVYVETPDSHLVALEASSGKEKWRVEFADSRLGYFATMAPIVVKNHVIVASGGDSLDLPGYLQSRDPETGALQWEWRTTPKPGRERVGDLAQRQRHGPWRRHALDARHIRPGNQPHLLGNGQPESGPCRSGARR